MKKALLKEAGNPPANEIVEMTRVRKSNGVFMLACLALLVLAGPASGQLEEPANELHTAPEFGDLRLMDDPNPRRNGHAGGFVGAAKRTPAGDGWETVRYTYRCGAAVITSTATPASTTGRVAELIDCESNTEQPDLDLRIHNIRDGGWYWMFRPLGDDVVAASAPLIRMDVLAEAPRHLPFDEDLGEIDADRRDVEVDDDGRGTGGATVFTDEGNRLFDIFPHSTPVLPTEICGPRTTPLHEVPERFNSQSTSSCALGDGRTFIRLCEENRRNVFDGAPCMRSDGSSEIGDESSDSMMTGSVTRPTSGEIRITADLWVNETGSISLSAAGVEQEGTGAADRGSETDIRRGWLGKTDDDQPDHERNWLDAAFTGSIVGVVNPPELGEAGIALDRQGADDSSDSAQRAVITIRANPDYCPEEGTQTAAMLDIVAEPGTSGFRYSADIFPPIALGPDAGLLGDEYAAAAARMRLEIVCPPQSSSSSQGEELVPENPFPTDE